MSALLTYSSTGRGAWPASGRGGTLSADGAKPGRFYRSPLESSSGATVGLTGYRASLRSTTCAVDDYATFRAVVAVQNELREQGLLGSDGRPVVADGLWGRNTDTGVRAFQLRQGLTPDGVFGAKTARAMFEPMARRVAAVTDPTGQVARLLVGTVTWESGWDPGAVGSATPQDLGLGQINGPAHPGMSAASRLDPRVALPYVAELITGNLHAMGGELRDAVAAYRYGIAGARAWVDAGRPQAWKGTDAWDYISTILNGGVRP